MSPQDGWIGFVGEFRHVNRELWEKINFKLNREQTDNKVKNIQIHKQNTYLKQNNPLINPFNFIHCPNKHNAHNRVSLFAQTSKTTSLIFIQFSLADRVYLRKVKGTMGEVVGGKLMPIIFKKHHSYLYISWQ